MSMIFNTEYEAALKRRHPWMTTMRDGETMYRLSESDSDERRAIVKHLRGRAVKIRAYADDVQRDENASAGMAIRQGAVVAEELAREIERGKHLKSNESGR